MTASEGGAYGEGEMGGPFHERPYPRLTSEDFGPGGQCGVKVLNEGRTVVIGDLADRDLQIAPYFIQPGPLAIDVHIHGLPGRFIEARLGRCEIPVDLVARFLEAHGIRVATPLRLITCHGAEAPLDGRSVAELLSTSWGGSVTAPNGLLTMSYNWVRISLVIWEENLVFGDMIPLRTGLEGDWITF